MENKFTMPIVLIFTNGLTAGKKLLVTVAGKDQMCFSGKGNTGWQLITGTVAGFIHRMI